MYRFSSANQQPASCRSFRPQLEALEDRVLPSGLAPMTPPLQVAPQALVSTIQVIEAPFMVTNTRVTADQAQLTPHDIKLDLEKAILPATTPVSTSPFADVPAGSIRTLEFEAGNGFVAKTLPVPVQRVEDDLALVKGVAEALLAQAKSYAQAAWRWIAVKAAGDLIAANPQIPLLKLIGAE
jgi:hypothetical protein